jgi:hypothetical protein
MSTLLARWGHDQVFRVHDLRCPEPYLGMIESGTKTFEVRPNDRGFQTGDVLRLYTPNEHGPDVPRSGGDRCRSVDCPWCKDEPNHAIRVITCVFTGDHRLPDNGGLREGYAVLGLIRPWFTSEDLDAAIDSAGEMET